ncbi:DUF1488 family protein [Acetobacter musti]|uniref:DUF1488 family protein n=1 Tax=Acetobacter musti TaxID=864732 RepID=A0ABX0JU68_9PROT|nr:DUF1488 family protein [Acetobacter musti]NHN85089.1 DUF1488 family protein [Acetobacter musti]
MTSTLPTSEQTETGPIPFEITAGTRRISCGVSAEALDAAAGLRSPSTEAARRQSFNRFRVLIHAAAKLKLDRCGKIPDGMIILGSDDLRHVPAEKGMPIFGGIPRKPAVSLSEPSPVTA